MKPLLCTECGERTGCDTGWGVCFGWRRCRDRDTCSYRVYLLTTEPPAPIEYEPEPSDIWVCSRCEGEGQHPDSQDWETGALRIVECGRCQSSGVEPGYMAAAS